MAGWGRGEGLLARHAGPCAALSALRLPYVARHRGLSPRRPCTRRPCSWRPADPTGRLRRVSPMPARTSRASRRLRDSWTKAGRRHPRLLTLARAFSSPRLAAHRVRGPPAACTCPGGLSGASGGEGSADGPRDCGRSGRVATGNCPALGTVTVRWPTPRSSHAPSYSRRPRAKGAGLNLSSRHRALLGRDPRPPSHRESLHR